MYICVIDLTFSLSPFIKFDYFLNFNHPFINVKRFVTFIKSFVYVARPKSPSCQWMRARWTSDPCYAFYGVDGSDCSFLVYLSEVEWFCPPVAWRNESSTPTHKPRPRTQVSSLKLLHLTIAP